MQSKILLKDEIYTGANGKSSLYDLELGANWNGELIVFIHGYMGYKDWGCWNLVQSFFVEQGYAFLKYNVSHNGGTISNPIDFDDLDSFAKNTYSKEILDFEAILNRGHSGITNRSKTHVIGHSRGGGTALLQSGNKEIDSIISWAGICDIGKRFPTGELLDNWKKNGVRYGKNGRANQEMPHNFEQYTDYQENADRLNIEAHCKQSKTPILIIHGDNDTSVSIDEGEKLATWTGTELRTIKNTQHTFDSKQPWNSNELPEALREVCEITLDFIKTT